MNMYYTLFNKISQYKVEFNSIKYFLHKQKPTTSLKKNI